MEHLLSHTQRVSTADQSLFDPRPGSMLWYRSLAGCTELLVRDMLREIDSTPSNDGQ
jgi:hypothetical protein